MAKQEVSLLDLPLADMMVRLGTSQAGLTSQVADERLEEYGPNEIAHRKQRGALIMFLEYFKNPLIIILLFAGLIAGILADITSMTIIFVIILIGVILDYFQESKAEQAAELLREKVTLTATVYRDGNKQEHKMIDIVPGDVIDLSAGDFVPGDVRLFTAKDLFVDQSALTGESFPVEKTVLDPANKSIIITERPDCLFMGSSIVSGTGLAVVVATGSTTEFGKIAQRLVSREHDTEFERTAKKFGFLIMEITIMLVLFVFFVLALFKGIILESFLFALALAVGLTPDLLPVIISINLSRGALAMSKKGVIVKRLTTIQNFGNMDILCTDKTGTLTENKITLILHINFEGKDDDRVLRYSFLNSYFQTGLKSALDEAVLEYKTIDVKDFEKADEIPFDFVRKRVSIVVHHKGQNYFITKGAPEEIIKICNSYELSKEISNLTPDIQAKINQKYMDLSKDGYRVLSVSYKKAYGIGPHQYSIDDEKDMTFLGFIAFIDPPKATAKESLQLLQKAGIQVKIITGDNDLVTKKTCEQLDFTIQGIALGTELPLLDDAALARVADRVNIFARVTPSQKSRIIQILKNNGHVVGYMGDGINDAPSIKIADVGISVDNAVDVAKGAADIILLEKKLRVLYDGVMEGRRTFNNTLKYILMSTSSNFGNMFSVAAAAVFLPFLPMAPTQILLNNLLYDVSETSIPTDNVDLESLNRPMHMDITYIRKFMFILGPASSIFDILTFLVLIFGFSADVHLFQTGWFVESICTQILVIFVLRTRVSPFWKSKISKPLLFSSLAIVTLGIIIPFTSLGAVFELTPLPPLYFPFLIIEIVSYLILIELMKRRFNKKYGILLETRTSEHYSKYH